MAQAPFQDNVVILTGASRGIGEQIAYQLADQGASLALAARSLERLEEVAARCRQRGGKALAVQTDVTDESQCKRLIERTVEFYGRIDTLLNDAGMGYPKRFEALTDLSHLKAEMELNFYGLVHCAFHALPHLKQTRGRLVAVSSFGGLIGIPGTIGYNSSKHALQGFMDTLRAELRGSGVSVTVVCPGAVRTARLEETMGANIDKVPTMLPERVAQIIIQQAARRKRQYVLTASGKTMVWLEKLAPSLADRILASVPINYED